MFFSLDSSNSSLCASVPLAAKVTVTDRKETELTLEWTSASDTDYTLMDDFGKNTTISRTSDLKQKVTHTVSDLSPGTKYNFTLLTTFENLTNKYEFTSVTSN